MKTTCRKMCSISPAKALPPTHLSRPERAQTVAKQLTPKQRKGKPPPKNKRPEKQPPEKHNKEPKPKRQIFSPNCKTLMHLGSLKSTTASTIAIRPRLVGPCRCSCNNRATARPEW